MGAAQSSNVANVATDIGNTIHNSTNINDEQMNAEKNTIDIKQCTITADSFSASIVSRANLVQRQITSVDGQNNLQNSVTQSALQSATSKVGSLGIGYANASNAVNLLTNITNNVIDQVSEAEQQFNNQSNDFICDDSSISIRGAFNIEITSDTTLAQAAISTNIDVTSISNQVSQSVKQTASATVEGIAGALIALAILIVAIGWSFGEVVESGASYVKPLIVAGVAILIGLFIFLAWYNSWGPFFNKLTPCTEATKIGEGISIDDPSSSCGTCIITDTNPQNTSIQNAPIKYNYPLFISKDISSLEGWSLPTIDNPGIGVGLFDIAATSGNGSNSSTGYNNAGYTIQSLITTNKLLSEFNEKLTAFKSVGIKNSIISKLVDLLGDNPIPPLLIDPNKNIIGTSAPPKGAKYITIPMQYQIGTASSSSTVPGLQGICTPGQFAWDTSTSVPFWTGWLQPSTTTSSSTYPPGVCYPSGGYWDVESSAIALTTDPTLGLANSNKEAFLNWMVKLSKELVKDSSLDLQGLDAQNVVSGFVRTMLVYLLNNWLKTAGGLPLEGSAYLETFEILIVSIQTADGVEDIILTEPQATEFPIIQGVSLTLQQFNRLKMYFVPNASTYNLLGYISGGGTIQMVQGVCGNKNYEVQRFMSTIGNYILLFLVLIALVVIYRA